MKLEKVAFTVYPTTNSSRAREFYEGILGLTVGSHSDNGIWTEYDLPGGGCFALFQNDGMIKPSASSGGTIAFEVDDLDGTIAHLKDKGVPIKMDIFHSPVCRQAVATDPDGNGLIFHQLKKKS
jgi:predicted enzyme related to lactoylglutathione lyase